MRTETRGPKVRLSGLRVRIIQINVQLHSILVYYTLSLQTPKIKTINILVENLLLMVSWIPFFKDAEKNILIKLIIMFLQNPCFTQKKRFSLLSKIKTINILVDNLENFWKHSLIDPFLKNNKMQRRTLFLSTFKNKNHKYFG